MDVLDRKIVEMLKVNARESFATIGKEVGLSAPAIVKRVRQMEEEGIIEGYTLNLNYEKLGIETKAYITIVMHRKAVGSSDAQKQLLAMEEVKRCDRVTGDDCLCVLAYFKNNRHLISFLEKIAEFGSSKTSIILEA